MGLFCNGLPFDYTFHKYKKVISNADGLSQFSVEDYELIFKFIIEQVFQTNYWGNVLALLFGLVYLKEIIPDFELINLPLTEIYFTI